MQQEYVKFLSLCHKSKLNYIKEERTISEEEKTSKVYHL